MIYTVTFNPSLDYVVDVKTFKTGQVNRTEQEKMFPGGKGINVSIVLNHLGLKSTAWGFLAGFTGEEISKRLDEEGVNTDFIQVEKGISRINVKLRSTEETEINGQGPMIRSTDIEKLYAKLDTLKTGDVLVLAGSIPDVMPQSIYMDIMKYLEGKDVMIAVDATRELLANVLPLHPFLIKPNNHELGQLFGVTISSKEDVKKYAAKLQEQGARNVLVSMAGDGAVLLTEEGKAFESEAPEGKVKNSVGAGDSMVAGFLAGYVVLLLRKICSKFPKSLEGIKPTLIYPLVGMFIVAVLMIFILNPIIGLINTGLSDMLTALANKNLLIPLGIILGGMMAIDMGGPINKAAYVYGTMVLATASELVAGGAQLSDPAVQACYISMASVMIGGMVPPLGIALACIFFPKKFTKAERNSTVSNIVMACGFITEGAIPFAAADPLHVIPCTLVGAAVAGGMSAAFKCTLMAPHGGIFVFATVGNWLPYIISWLVGSVITCIMLGLIKRNVQE